MCIYMSIYPSDLDLHYPLFLINSRAQSPTKRQCICVCVCVCVYVCVTSHSLHCISFYFLSNYLLSETGNTHLSCSLSTVLSRIVVSLSSIMFFFFLFMILLFVCPSVSCFIASYRLFRNVCVVIPSSYLRPFVRSSIPFHSISRRP